MEQGKKLSKGRIKAIIVTGISCVVAIALIITNFFIPVKYLASYLVIGNKGAKDGLMRVRFVDVGYGDCTIVELPDGKNMLIDAGNGTTSNQSRILKFLNKCGIDTIDYLVCTSVNSEHCGGLAEIIQYKNVNKIFLPACFNKYVTDEYYKFCLAAESSSSELIFSEYGTGEYNSEYNYFFGFLSPSVYGDPQGEYANLNSNITSLEARCDASAVLWLEYGDTRFLFLSDVTDTVETKLVNDYKLLKEVQESYCPIGEYSVQLENCNIVKVANHGSENSACAELYDYIKPEISVISVGENAQGCPSLSAISNAGLYGDLYRTDEYGTLTIEVTETGYSVV